MVTHGSRKCFRWNPQDFRDGCKQGRRDVRGADQLPAEDGSRGDIPAPGGQQVRELAALKVPLHACRFQARPAQPPARVGDES